MAKTETVALARKAYGALYFGLGLPDRIETARGLALEGERRHRRGDFARYHPGAASAPACAELFVARWIAEYAMKPETMPTVADLGRIRDDVMHCASIVQNAGPANVLACLRERGLDPATVAALDYVAAVSKARV